MDFVTLFGGFALSIVLGLGAAFGALSALIGLLEIGDRVRAPFPERHGQFRFGFSFTQIRTRFAGQ